MAINEISFLGKRDKNSNNFNNLDPKMSRQMVESFVELPDEVLIDEARSKAIKDETRRNKKMNTAAWMSVVGLSALNRAVNVTKKSSLAGKTFAFAGEALSLGTLLMIPTIYSKVSNKVAEKTGNKRKNSFGRALFDIAAVIGLTVGSIFLGNKVLGKFSQKHPEKVKNIISKELKLAKNINKSKFNNKIYKPVMQKLSNLTAKSSFAKASSSVLKGALSLSPWVLLGAILIKSGTPNIEKVNKNTIDNYNEMKRAQDNLKDFMNISYTEDY